MENVYNKSLQKVSNINSFILDTIVQVRPAREAMKLYDEWADNYDLYVKTVEYRAPVIIAEEFKKLQLPKNISILDLAAGTGLVGEEMIKNGYQNIDALDGSSEMLRVARQKSVYRSHTKALVVAGHRLPMETDSYDAAVCAGAVIPGHIRIKDLADVIRIVKPGGFICWTVSYQYDDRNEKFTRKYIDQMIEKWQRENKWTSVEGYPIDLPNYKLGFDCTVYIMKIK